MSVGKGGESGCDLYCSTQILLPVSTSHYKVATKGNLKKSEPSTSLYDTIEHNAKRSQGHGVEESSDVGTDT